MRNFKSIAVHAKKDDDQPSIRRERERERDVKEWRRVIKKCFKLHFIFKCRQKRGHSENCFYFFIANWMESRQMKVNSKEEENKHGCILPFGQNG